MESKKRFIEFMIASDVLKFGDFVTKSGRNTPYFVNTGNYKTGEQISKLSDFYAELIKEVTGGDFDAIFGPAYKGIPISSSVAGALYRNHNINKPYFFNRKEVKDHGEGGDIIGYKPVDGDKIVITEDVITAGTAVREVMPILSSYADITVPFMFISVDRCEVGTDGKTTAVKQVHDEFGISVHAIVTVKDIYEYLKISEKYSAYTEKMENYMERYCVLG